MKTVLKLAIAAVMLLALMFLVPSAAFLGFSEEAGEIVEIPLDAELRIKKEPELIPAPLESGFVSDTEYTDPSLSVSITTGFWIDTNYVVARVQIANPTQIRSAINGSYAHASEVFGDRLAKSVNAVLAINGNFFNKRLNKGLTIRQGKTYFMPKSDRQLGYSADIQYDILLIDDQGDLHIVKEATLDDLHAFQGTVINAFTFGPGLVIDGVKQESFQDTNNGPGKKTQRMAIAQTGPLTYLCICCEGPNDPGSQGLTMAEFADLVASQEGVVNAYNLDGGASSVMLFNGEKVNCPNTKARRQVVDILYFASAFVPAETAEEQ